MKKCKFKVGDIVKATTDGKYVITCRSNDWVGQVTKVGKYSFEARTIRSKTGHKNFPFDSLDYRNFEKVEDDSVVITEHLIRGNKTIVKLSNGKVGIAIRNHDDEFDAAVGAAIATLRAYGKNVEDFAKEFTACEHKENPKNRELFRVGQLVQIKDWGEMEREYGLDRSGDILCHPNFTKGMKPLCGMFAEIIDIDGPRIWLKFFNFDGDTDWCYSTDMIKPIDKKEK